MALSQLFCSNSFKINADEANFNKLGLKNSPNSALLTTQSEAITPLPIGANGKVLGVVDNSLEWVTISGPDPSALIPPVIIEGDFTNTLQVKDNSANNIFSVDTTNSEINLDATTLKIPNVTGADTSGYVLTTDGTGVATFQASSGGNVSITSGNTNITVDPSPLTETGTITLNPVLDNITSIDVGNIYLGGGYQDHVKNLTTSGYSSLITDSVIVADTRTFETTIYLNPYSIGTKYTVADGYNNASTYPVHILTYRVKKFPLPGSSTSISMTSDKVYLWAGSSDGTQTVIKNPYDAAPTNLTSVIYNSLSGLRPVLFTPDNSRAYHTVGTASNSNPIVYYNNTNTDTPSVGGTSINSTGIFFITPDSDYLYTFNRFSTDFNTIYNVTTGTPTTGISISPTGWIWSNYKTGCVTPNGMYSYYTAHNSSLVLTQVENTSTLAPSILQEITLPATCHTAGKVTNNGNYLYLTLTNNTLEILSDASTASPTSLVNIPQINSAITFSPNGDIAYCFYGSNLKVITNAQTGTPTVEHTIAITNPHWLGVLTLSDDGAWLYIMTMDGVCIIKDANATPIVLGYIKFTFEPTNMIGPDPTNKYLWVTGNPDNNVWRIELYDLYTINTNNGAVTVINDDNGWMIESNYPTQQPLKNVAYVNPDANNVYPYFTTIQGANDYIRDNLNPSQSNQFVIMLGLEDNYEDVNMCGNVSYIGLSNKLEQNPTLHGNWTYIPDVGDSQVGTQVYIRFSNLYHGGSITIDSTARTPRTMFFGNNAELTNFTMTGGENYFWVTSFSIWGDISFTDTQVYAMNLLMQPCSFNHTNGQLQLLNTIVDWDLSMNVINATANFYNCLFRTGSLTTVGTCNVRFYSIAAPTYTFNLSAQTTIYTPIVGSIPTTITTGTVVSGVKMPLLLENTINTTINTELLVRDKTTGLVSKLENGINGNVLTISGGNIAWAAPVTSLQNRKILVGNPSNIATQVCLSGDVVMAGDISGGLASTTVNKINNVLLSGLATGILKNTTGTGAPSIAVAGDFPTLNQNTTGSSASCTGNSATATTLQTARTINGVSFNGSANISTPVVNSSDVLISNLEDHQVIQYNSTSTKWENRKICMPLGELWFSDQASPYAETLTTINTYYALNPATSLESNNSDFPSAKFSSPQAGRLQYLGMHTELFHVAISLSASVNTAGEDYRVGVLKNGATTPESGTVAHWDFVSNGTRTSYAFHKVISLAQNDFIEIGMVCVSASGKIVTINNLNLVAMSCCPY